MQGTKRPFSRISGARLPHEVKHPRYNLAWAHAMVQTMKYSCDFTLSSCPSGWLETVSEKTHHAQEIRNFTLLWLLANCIIDSAEGESKRVLSPSSVFSFCCPCSSIWDQLGRKKGQVSGPDPDSCPGGPFLLENYGARRLHTRPQSWLVAALDPNAPPSSIFVFANGDQPKQLQLLPLWKKSASYSIDFKSRVSGQATFKRCMKTMKTNLSI